MGKRPYVILSFLIFSVIIFLTSVSFNSPYNFISGLFSAPRTFLYSAVFASGQTGEDKLKAENLELRQKLANLAEIKKDNEALRAQFVEQFIPSKNLLPAKIAGFKGNLNNPSAFILNQGERSGVKPGMAVVSGKVLVGKIGKATENYSEVILPFNKNFSTLGTGSKNNASGIVSGQEDFIIFDHVLITDNLSKNEDIVTKGELDTLGNGIPQGLIIGKIMQINKIETKPFQDAIIKSPLNFTKLSTIFIIVK